MKSIKIISALLVTTVVMSGCSPNRKSDNQADNGSEDETPVITTESETTYIRITSAEPEPAYAPFEFNPHVYSPTLAIEIPQDYWDSFYNMCDALRSGETTFECSSKDAYDFCMTPSTTANLFPAACLKITGDSNDGTKPYENGVGRIYYNMPVEDFVVRQAEFEELITDIINSTLESDDTDFEKCLKLYLYIAENYDYEEDSGEITGDASFYSTFITKKGMCVDYGAVYGYLLLQVGIDALDIGCFEPDMCHAWTYVVLNGQGYHVDTTWALTSCYDMQDVYMDYFLMSDQDRNEDGCLVRDLTMQALPQFFLCNSNITLSATDETYSFPDFSTFVSLDEENKILYYQDMYGNIYDMKYDI